MSVRINYEYETVTIPARAIPVMERASTADIRLLMALCADSSLRSLPEDDFASFARAAGCTEAQAAASLAFWRGAGILLSDGAADVQPARVSGAAGEAKPAGEHQSVSVTAEENPPQEAPTQSREEQWGTVPDGTESSPDGKQPGGERVRKPSRHDQLPLYTTEQITHLLETHPDTAEFLDESARVWGKIFNTHEVNILLGLVDYLGLDWEYVLILLAYCKKLLERRGSSGSLHYVETVAFNFYDEGIHTPEALQEKIRQLDLMAETESKLRKLFGIGTRTLTATEKRTFSAWLYDFNYGLDIIQKAYEITVDTIGEPKLKYMNSILSKWNSEKLDTLEAIDAYQAEHGKEQGKKAPGQRATQKPGTRPGGSFDTEDFFGDAVRRSFGEDFDPEGK